MQRRDDTITQIVVFAQSKSGSYSIQADCFIYGVGNENIQKSLVVTRPLFMYPKGNEYSTTMETRDTEYKDMKIKRKKLHDDSRIFIEENFFFV